MFGRRERSLVRRGKACHYSGPAPDDVDGGEYVAQKPVEFKTVPGIPKEGYELDITPAGMTVRSSDGDGAFWATMTILHMGRRDPASKKIVYLCLKIVDAPKFSWRGVQLDDVRSWLGKDVIKRTLRQMSWYKLNVLHWHLTDDEGWRFAVPGYPQLTAKGAYSDADIKEILAYAASLHITVVPEIEFPGHFGSVTRAYPQFACPLKGVRPDAQHHILGGQCNNWTTHTSNSPVLEWKLWPRGMALAEVLWTYPETRDFADFARRAKEHRRRLIHAHVNCAPVVSD